MNKNKPLLFLSIGVTKTGSSSLKCFLNDKIPFLEKNGIIYPLLKLNEDPHHQIRMVPVSHAFFAISLMHGNYDACIVRENVAYLADKAYNLNKNILLSSEAFSAILSIKTINFFCDLLNRYFDIVIIACVRDPLSWFFSRYNQEFKGAGPAAFNNFPDFVQNFHIQLPHAATWLSYASKAHIYSYDEHKNDLLSPFFTILGINLSETQDSGSLSYKLPFVNRSLSDSEMAFLMAYDKTPALQGHGVLRCKIVEAFMSSGKKMEEMSFCSPDPALAELAEARHEEFFQALEPYLPRERIIHPIRATGPIMNDDTFKIDPADMSLALKVIEEYFKNRN